MGSNEYKSRELAARFTQLHKKREPLVLVNAWDAWSAIACEAAGHKAVATSSHAVAESLGFRDGQVVSRQAVIARVQEISRTVSVPLSVGAPNSIASGYRFDGLLLAIAQTNALVDEAIRRSKLYQEAGASGLFVPGLTQLDLIERLSRSIALPLKVMMWPGCPSIGELTAAGVSRVSLGGWPFEFLRDAFRRTLKGFSTDSFCYFGHVDRPSQA